MTADRRDGSPTAAGPSDPTEPPADGRGVLVVVPTYDERENLPGLVERILATLPAVRLLVVDDGSPDGTGALADDLAARDPRLSVLHHHPRRGLGAAYVDAFAHVMATHPASEIGWVVEMDADGSHAPEDLPALLASARAEGADLVLGSRYVPGGRVVNWPWYRNALSRSANVYSRRALRLPVRDVTGGFRLYRRGVLDEVTRTPVSSQGYCFQVDMAFRVQRGGHVVREVPITFTERAAGASKMSGAVVREALWRITAWAVRDRLNARKRSATRQE
ncbi:polyprenol monophosphomannose synthase [Actinomycetospora endophytica]|uniref:Polyprenol monophosphomannose synthase n=1 Tax=Actinomycetospora endophytica TaxID=2291215 RepID=A0ABS8P9K1_9PSEU|nr:polyprenol monophosphomannose synthase [Actinomycetospora endophytica]MCD2194948.1 polyprenol monophosphomannose synthase [Actinomycetospora endophytica]